MMSQIVISEFGLLLVILILLHVNFVPYQVVSVIISMVYEETETQGLTMKIAWGRSQDSGPSCLHCTLAR